MSIITWLKSSILVIVIFFFTIEINAQDDYEVSSVTSHEDITLHVNAIVGIPSKDLKQAVRNQFGDIGIGLSAGLFINPFIGKEKPSLILPGVDFNYMMYGIDWIDETGSTPGMKTIFNYYTIQGGFRLIPSQYTSFSPFIDGLIGTKIFNTKTRIRGDSEVIHSTNEAGLNYGLGIGFYTRKKNTPHQPVSLDFRFLYFWGDDTKYIVRNSFSVDQNNNLIFETGRTNTNMLTVQLGIIIH